MISVEEATNLVQQQLWNPSVSIVPLDQSPGRVLAREVRADRDLPPYDRVAMDGIAVRQAELLNGILDFRISGTAPAGEPQYSLGAPGTCMEVMTGAVLPSGADAVVRYEDLTIENGVAHVNQGNIVKGNHIHVKGSDIREGEVILRQGTVISPAEVPILASVGMTGVSVYSGPKVALVTTGDELVAVDEIPLPHQIRRSNMYAVKAALAPYGVDCTMHHFGDHDWQADRNDVLHLLSSVVHEADVVILSGGVSKGKFDWVPAALQSLGIICIFHSVAQRPGKPLWFGAGNGKVVFALPGNPVSVFLCLYRYVLPWLRKSLHHPERSASIALASDFRSDIPLTHFVQVKLSGLDMRSATPVPGGGSGDFVNLRLADGFIEIPPKAGIIAAGSVFPYIPFRA